MRNTYVTLAIMSTLALTACDQKSANQAQSTPTVSDSASRAAHNQKSAPAEQDASSSLTGPQNNAARSAKQYLSMQGFSCKGLIQQLSSSAGDRYTVSQATYGAHHAGAC
ncbi:Ltp family lipoprotein [Burkholderia stagnalis]|uniref:Ltp family lipoprotein n=2 Tax=Burkholderia stagnalis TaxID=1503054 RepID=UPI002ED8E8FF